MKLKKIFIIYLILFVGATGLNTVSSSGFLEMMEITPFDVDTVVEIDDFNFTIPEGYGEDDRYMTQTIIT